MENRVLFSSTNGSPFGFLFFFFLVYFLEIMFKGLLPPTFKETVHSWIKEDIPSFDYGGYVVGDDIHEATLFAKSPGIISGIPFFTEVFNYLNCTVEWYIEEGASNTEKTKIATVRGPIRNILMGERTALNIMTRCSGISTAAHTVVDLVRKEGWNGTVCATRKTTPGFRLVEKYAVLVGGAATHRMDLSSMVMLKDNHVWATGSIKDSVHKARDVCGFSSKIEVEVSSYEEAVEAIEAGADVIMLDNFTPETIHVVGEKLKKQYPHGITIHNIQSYLSPYIDVYSMGCLTQGYSCMDLSLKVNKD
ncbi:hypothetical protein WA158_005699 [Blastocystis sp. Blastoise]